MIRELYGVCIYYLKLPPSEVRQMTIGEAYAIIDAITERKSNVDMDSLKKFAKARGFFNGK
jgi:hypothetical protein